MASPLDSPSKFVVRLSSFFIIREFFFRVFVRLPDIPARFPPPPPPPPRDDDDPDFLLDTDATPPRLLKIDDVKVRCSFSLFFERSKCL